MGPTGGDVGVRESADDSAVRAVIERAVNAALALIDSDGDEESEGSGGQPGPA